MSLDFTVCNDCGGYEMPLIYRKTFPNYSSICLCGNRYDELTECQGDPFGSGFHPSDHAASGVDGAPRFNPYRKGKAA